MQIYKENINSDIEKANTLNIREELEKYLFHWKWFTLGVIISVLMAFLYLRYSTPQYRASTSIMIKDNKNSGISKEFAAFEDLGIVGGSANNTDNEIEILKSRKIIGSVVDTLDLTTIYYTQGRIIRAESYNNKAILIDFESKNERFIKKFKDTSFTVSVLSSNKFELKDIDNNLISTNNFNDFIVSDIGNFKVVKTEEFDFKEKQDIYISILNRDGLIDYFKKGLNISVADKKSSVLRLSFTYPVKKKAEVFLNELVDQYNHDAIKDKNEVSQKTKNFIDERLFAIGKDLNSIQDRVKKFKTDNKITGLSTEGELALATASKNNENLIKISTELNIAEGVLKNINDSSGKLEILPQNIGLSDVGISQSINNYNSLVTVKNRLSVNAGSKNPQILQYKKEINSLKLNLKKSITNLIFSLQTQYNQVNNEANKINSKVSAIPILERGYIDIEREQEIISGLYSYLLKKKEETAISLAVTVPNAKIIDVAYSSKTPVSPRRKVIFLSSLFLGLLIPFYYHLS